MADKLHYISISNGDYHFYSLKYFFGFGDENYSFDPIRILKLLYILISFILNTLIVISIFKKKRRKLSTALVLTGNLLLINFIHTFSYSFEWILKEEDGSYKKILYIDEKGTILNNNETLNIEEVDHYEVGGLLVGNALNLGACKTQGFFLIFSALSQDIFINIFFYLINKSKLPSRNCIRLFVIIFGYCIPFTLGLVFVGIDGLGINDRFCYIKKFNVNHSLGSYTYTYNKNQFHALLIIIYGIRTVNLIMSLLLIYKIIKYVNDNKIDNKNKYILKTTSILIVQVITIIFGLIYRISSIFHESFSRKFANVYLCFNTLDGILFPLCYSISNGVYKNLFGKPSNKEILESSNEQDFTTFNKTTSKFRPSPTVEKTFPLVDIRDDNNFSLSYA